VWLLVVLILVFLWICDRVEPRRFREAVDEWGRREGRGRVKERVRERDRSVYFRALFFDRCKLVYRIMTAT